MPLRKKLRLYLRAHGKLLPKRSVDDARYALGQYSISQFSVLLQKWVTAEWGYSLETNPISGLYAPWRQGLQTGF